MQLLSQPSAKLKLLSIAVLATLTYLPALVQPFIEDDYPIIVLSRSYGPPVGWSTMMRDQVNRVRATTFVVTHCIDKIAGANPMPFYASSIALHILNCWLIYLIGGWELIGYRVSFWSACFFAVYEGHQEAVMWYAAANELLLFFFGMICVLAWLAYLRKGNLRWLALAVTSLLLSFLSKESSIVFIPLLLLVAWKSGLKSRRALMLVFFAIAAVVYALLIFKTHELSFRFHDQSFELSAPFWETWTKSYFGLLLPWGWAALIVLAYSGKRSLMTFCLSWVGISFLPYMFVNYVHSIPSRQTYLASLGLALLVGAAVAELWKVKSFRWAVILLLLLMVAHNVSYIWFVKHKQFLLRAQPTEELVKFAQAKDGPIYVKCFPRPAIIGDSVIEVRLNKPAHTLIWDEGEARRLGVTTTFCYQK